MLKDEKGTDAAQLEITGTKLSVQNFCKTAGKEDSKIREAPHL
jgi:acid stress chaperone HdeA